MPTLRSGRTRASSAVAEPEVDTDQVGTGGWITVLTPEVMPREILEVKVATQSSRVQVFGIFAGPRGPQRVQGRYSPESGGIYLEYTIPAEAQLGPRTASLTVQQIGTSREETLRSTTPSSRSGSSSDRPPLQRNVMPTRLLLLVLLCFALPARAAELLQELSFVEIPAGTLLMGTTAPAIATRSPSTRL